MIQDILGHIVKISMDAGNENDFRLRDRRLPEEAGWDARE